MVISGGSPKPIASPRKRYDSGASDMLELAATGNSLSASLPANVNLVGLDEVPVLASITSTERRNGLYPKLDAELPRPRVSSLNTREKPSGLQGRRRIKNKLRDIFKRGSSKNIIHNMDGYQNGGLGGVVFSDSIDVEDLDLEEPGLGGPGQRSRHDSRGDSRSASSASTRRDSEDSGSSHSGSQTPRRRHLGAGQVIRKIHEKALDILDKLGLATQESFDSTVTTERVTAAQIQEEREHAREVIESFTEFGQVTATTDPEEMELLGITHVLPAYLDVPEEGESRLRPVCSSLNLEAAEVKQCKAPEACPFYDFLQRKDKLSPVDAERRVPVAEERTEPLEGMEVINYDNPYRYRSATTESKRKR
ncbi:uncharacterized protein LOC129585308 [Paramacrobiotus metropolitanus]|uniref:uncharacterized protein LOC129585308 n=1 Tax=Paramacrobiotus metropolitanus TaxID=2943436 RepID=UPI002445E8AF|nr:uncharacterized protein LOC129585308 [Paramacrobiotus metropolitanus]